MKKLLSLLSVTIIASGGMAWIVANSPYKKQEQQTKLENLNYKRQKRSNNENINRANIVITTNGQVDSSGVVLNDKVYFGSNDGKVYEYDPVTDQQKIVIKTGGQIWSSGVVLNNKLYFGSWDYNVYEYDPVTDQQKIVIKTNNWIASSGVVLNNKLYFGSGDYNVYEYDPVTDQQKIVIKTGGQIRSSGVVLNNKLYFGSGDKNVYEYDPVTKQKKIVIKTKKAEYFWSSGVVLNNKVYFGSDDHNVYEYDPVTDQQKIVIKTNSWIESSGLVLNNKLYFGSYDKNVYEYDPVTNQQKIVIKTNGEIWCSGVVFNNKLYFGSWDHNVYEYDPITDQQKVVITTNNKILSSGVVLNNKVYFGSDDHNVYEYSKYNLNLGQINDNSDNIILNELSYLNPDLNISQLEIVKKTNNSAIVIVKEKNNSNKYLNENKIYYTINKQENINLNESIKKASFFKFRDENPNLIFKAISNVNSDNLNFSNVEVTKDSKLLHTVDFRAPCFKRKERINTSSVIKTVKIPKCDYNSKSKLVFQITTGLTKTKQENKLNGWNINPDDEMKLSDFINLNNKQSEIINELSNNFDLSNINKQEQVMILYSFGDIEDEVDLAPQERIVVKYSVRETYLETTLNLKQKINGNITTTVIKNDGENKTFTISIKEAMQLLQKYSLLPDEITINEDDSITFNGKGKISLTQEGEPKLIMNTSINI